MRAGALLLLASFAASCAAAPERTAVVVVVDADQAVQERAREVRITVRGGKGGSSTWAEVYDQQLEPIEWPFSLPLEPIGGDASRGYEVTISARDRDGEFSRVRAISSYVEGRVITLPLFLEAQCIDVECGASRTCAVVEGDADCVSAEVGAEQLEGAADASAAADAARDAGAEAAPPDAAPDSDAPTLDAAPEDSSSDGPPEPSCLAADQCGIVEDAPGLFTLIECAYGFNCVDRCCEPWQPPTPGTMCGECATDGDCGPGLVCGWGEDDPPLFCRFVCTEELPIVTEMEEIETTWHLCPGPEMPAKGQLQCLTRPLGPSACDCWPEVLSGEVPL